MAKNNTSITFKGERLELQGQGLREGDRLPSFVLTGPDMADVKSSSVAGKVLVISCVPSLDTPVCAVQTKRFNTAALNLASTVTILTVSMDLPFAQKRWCGAENVQRIMLGSDFKYRSFGPAFGVFIPAWGLLSRAVFVADPTGLIVHVEYVDEISSEPDYPAVLAKVSMLVD